MIICGSEVKYAGATYGAIQVIHENRDMAPKRYLTGCQHMSDVEATRAYPGIKK
jgi:hypothetical protein